MQKVKTLETGQVNINGKERIKTVIYVKYKEVLDWIDIYSLCTANMCRCMCVGVCDNPDLILKQH